MSTDDSRGGFVAATRLVAEREVRTFLRAKGFWIGFGVVLVGLFALSVLPSVFGGGRTEVAAVGSRAAEVLAGADLDVRTVPDLAAAQDLVRSEEVSAAVVPDTTGGSATGVRVVARNDPPTDVVAALRTAPPVDLLEPSEVGSGQRQLVIMVFALVFLVFGMGGTAIAQSTVTEKQTRIVEILVSTVPVRALLAGKIAGHVLLTVAQVVVLAVAAPVALRLGGHSELLTLVAPALGWFVPFLVLGFVLLASMWAVAGSLVSRQEDLGSSMGLVVMLVMGPYFGVMFFAENTTVLTVLSYVPFSSAIAMPVRMFAGQAATWEALVALGLLAGTAVLAVLLAGRIYSGSLLHTGGRLALAKAWARER
ncbi:ABC transporter permease [Saccharothrix australiensis]|uniref:ABC-2 type transport system permease protein n=1 Tax=Saccharothrix australiensis TaxID=2072 RepID=A0A495VYP4_9PSEU|nr:ABC transporter permease [Saccharothrix australiensis]RKT53877.1 ABC-2 type transport system permease protein [Saccharothrix australiensis]